MICSLSKEIEIYTWNEPCDVNKSSFPEFMNYQIDSQQGLSTTEIYKKRMMNVFGTIGDGVSGAAKKVTQTIQETLKKSSQKDMKRQKR